jgi:GNAT superfamily N-acetyltransferase
VEIRRARTEDAGTLTTLFLAAKRAAMPYLPEIHSDEETRHSMERGVLAECEVWVVEEEGEVAGFAALRGDLLEHLYVAPGTQRRGIGGTLFVKAIELSPGGFRLWVFQRNERARRFYEARGCRLLELTDGSGNEEREPDALYEWRPSPG